MYEISSETWPRFELVSFFYNMVNVMDFQYYLYRKQYWDKHILHEAKTHCYERASSMSVIYYILPPIGGNVLTHTFSSNTRNIHCDLSSRTYIVNTKHIANVMKPQRILPSSVSTTGCIDISIFYCWRIRWSIATPLPILEVCPAFNNTGQHPSRE